MILSKMPKTAGSSPTELSGTEGVDSVFQVINEGCLDGDLSLRQQSSPIPIVYENLFVDYNVPSETRSEPCSPIVSSEFSGSGRVKWQDCNKSYPTYSRFQYDRRTKERRYTVRELGEIQRELDTLREELFPNLDVHLVGPAPLLRPSSLMERVQGGFSRSKSKLKKFNAYFMPMKESSKMDSTERYASGSGKLRRRGSLPDVVRSYPARDPVDLSNFGRKPRLRSVI